MKKQNGMSLVGVLIVLLLMGFLGYQFMKPIEMDTTDVNSEKISAPKNQKQVQDMKKKLNESVKTQQNKRDEAWEKL